mmetsp:Transcript_24850/g.44991  ORF Transcript_24850/g.44991 Transcript_24850/m.44991 type:complete len:468 (-) Transcript_24850:90-1493(-)|eukprot:CAMPEP_0197651010 /NCGR_PEP_ID=MMETSP1338-20131121/31296_1 /TAXON_ID=43686 ORGANISM="Pelagodinium beii, Strain RCC1491" /NCGR_SAMPLE_ID=MMETSP1338 /ASSEMBLY_ACC=CAM_ASM_000754 /LENGTH=467 /DNA_ID=CAMNT_0043225549 /DNA_START=103 /DNA_END=1506 /DNA_ORIENTATION=-
MQFPAAGEEMTCDPDSPLASKLLLTKRSRAFRSVRPCALKEPDGFTLQEDQLQAAKNEEFVAEEEESPIGCSLRAIRRARAFGGEAASSAARARTALQMPQEAFAADEEDSPVSSSLRAIRRARAFGGAEAADKVRAALRGPQDASEGEDETSLGCSLRAIRRARAFQGAEAAEMTAARARASMEIVQPAEAGLSQSALDLLSVACDSDESEEDAASTKGSKERMLLKFKRLKAYRGSADALAFAQEMLQEVASTASTGFGSRCSSGSGRLSQVDLDHLSVHEPSSDARDAGSETSESEGSLLLHSKRLHAFEGEAKARSFAENLLQDSTQAVSEDSGLSQAELDALCIHEPSAKSADGDDTEESEAQLLRVRRLRAHGSAEEAEVFAKKALDKATNSGPADTEDDTSSPTRKSGKSQLELNRLCIEAPDDCGSSPCGAVSPTNKVASPQRKRQSKASFSSPVRGGA